MQIVIAVVVLMTGCSGPPADRHSAAAVNATTSSGPPRFVETLQVRLDRARAGDGFETCTLIRDLTICKHVQEADRQPAGTGVYARDRAPSELKRFEERVFGSTRKAASAFCEGFSDHMVDRSVRNELHAQALHGDDFATRLAVAVSNPSNRDEMVERTILEGLSKGSRNAAWLIVHEHDRAARPKAVRKFKQADTLVAIGLLRAIDDDARWDSSLIELEQALTARMTSNDRRVVQERIDAAKCGLPPEPYLAKEKPIEPYELQTLQCLADTTQP